MTLKNLNTYNFVDATGTVPDEDHEIRMSVGWRSKEKDAYDVTSFTITYDRDYEKVKFTAIDGEAFGSSSGYYNSVWEYDVEADHPTDVDSAGNAVKGYWKLPYETDGGKDYNGWTNTTIK
tara:strand:+ start:97 stop:459 length:363 start_codon:yes stop_codon:yes gene_type:complete